MDAMIIISNKKIDMVDVMEQWKQKGVRAYIHPLYQDNSWVIDSKKAHLYIDYSQSDEDYEEGELDHVDIGEKHFYAIFYRNYQFLKKFLFETDFKIDKMYIDDDHCTILPFEEFKMLTKNDEEEYYISIIERKTFS